MAKLIKEVKPTKKTYLVELEQDEVDMLLGIVKDFLDNPQRKITMKYGVDENSVVPSERGYKILKRINKGIGDIDEGPDYDYFDFWEDADFDA